MWTSYVTLNDLFLCRFWVSWQVLAKKYVKTSDQSIFSLYIVTKRSFLQVTCKLQAIQSCNQISMSVSLFFNSFCRVYKRSLLKSRNISPKYYPKLFRSTEKVCFSYCRFIFFYWSFHMSKTSLHLHCLHNVNLHCISVLLQ